MGTDPVMCGWAELIKQLHDEPVISEQIAFEDGLVMEDAVAEVKDPPRT